MDNKQIAKEIVKSRFKDDKGKPFELTDSQAEIFLSIFLKQNPRVQIIASTQYGKSETVAIALICRTFTFKDKFTIIAPSQPKADIIMQKVIQHIFDYPEFASALDFEGEKIERLRQERSRKRITWKTGGEVRAITADARNRTKVKEALMGFGCENIIEDEAALIPNDLQSTILRMLGGYKDNFLLKIGNPFYRNHFFKTWNSNKYQKIFIDYHTAIKEGRYSNTFIDEMRDEAFFDVLYECKFPTEDQIDASGYRRLLTDTEIDNAQVDQWIEGGDNRLGIDVGGGGDKTTFIQRNDRCARVLDWNKSRDTMTVVSETQRLMDDIDFVFSAIDDVGIGRGASDRLNELGIPVQPVNVGESSSEPDKFLNKKAENYWQLAKWIKNGGKLLRDDAWNELRVIRYKVNSDKQIKIKSKEELAKEGIHSPDFVEGLMLTFEEQDNIEIRFI